MTSADVKFDPNWLLTALKIFSSHFGAGFAVLLGFDGLEFDELELDEFEFDELELKTSVTFALYSASD